MGKRRKSAETWNDRLNWAIKDRGVTKAALARACKISRPSVGEWTDGTTGDPKLAPFFAACDFLRVRPRWLALGELPVDIGPDESPQQLVELQSELALVPDERELAAEISGAPPAMQALMTRMMADYFTFAREHPELAKIVFRELPARTVEKQHKHIDQAQAKRRIEVKHDDD